jgi:hypothetical protein
LDIGSGDDFFEQRFALYQRKFSKILTVEVEQVEGDHHYFGRLTLQLILQHREIGSPVAAGTTTSPSMIADPALSAKRRPRSSGSDWSNHCLDG